MKDTVIIFDLDGTLHHTDKVYLPVFYKVFNKMLEDGVVEPRELDPDKLTKYLGCNVNEMWADFMPNASKEVTSKYSSLIGLGMIESVSQGNAVLYDGVEDTLQQLHDMGYRMVLLSNCRVKYMENVAKHFNFDRFFEGYYPCEKYNFIPKEEIFEYIKAEHPAEEYIVVGDRRHDMALAAAHNLSSIGCLYGFGDPEELETADHLAEKPADLLKYLKR